MAYIGNNPKWNTGTYTPQSTQPANPVEGMTYYDDGTNLPEGAYIYKNGNWTTLGGGGAQNFYETGDADSSSTSNFSTGNNATFDGGGSLQGVFSISSTAADIISGDRAFKLVLNATPGNSDDDYVASEAIDIPQGYRGRDLQVKFQYKYDGADSDIKWVVKDQTNAILISEQELNAFDNADNTAAEIILRVFCPADATQIKVGPQVITHATGSEEIIWDDAIVNAEQVSSTSLQESQTLWLSTHAGYGSTNTVIPYFTNTQESNTQTLFTVDNDSTNGLSITAIQKCTVDIQYTFDSGGGTEIGFSLNSSQLTTAIASINESDRLVIETVGSTARSSVSVEVLLEPGDVLRPHSEGSAANIASRCTFIATATKVISVFQSTIGANEFAAVLTNGGSAAITSQTGDFIASVNRPSVGIVDITLKSGVFDIIPAVVATSNAASGIDSRVTSVSTTAIQITSRASTTGTLTDADFDVKVTKQGTDYANNNTLIVPAVRRCIIIDEKANGSQGGTGTATTWTDRDLNTIFGEQFASVSSNQFTLPAGKYHIRGTAPFSGSDSARVKFRDITNAADVAGSLGSVVSTGANVNDVDAQTDAVIEITETTTFSLQYFINQSISTSDLGRNNIFGTEAETFARVIIDKVL